MADRGSDNEARREMLAAIRRQLAAAAPPDAARDERAAHHDITERTPPQAVDAPEPTARLVDRFRQSLEAVGGHCAVVRDEGEAAEAVRRVIESLRARRIAVTDSPLVRRIIAGVRADAVWLEDAAPPALFDCDLGITGADWAVAETGTLVLESDRETHRLASLVPPAHVAIVAADRVRQTLAEVLTAVGEQGPDGLSRAITFITGPSRTSDIELTLTIGVHGPGDVYVILIEGGRHDG